MKRRLVIQLARLGDLLQTRRLYASLRRDADGSAVETHLLIDRSLTVSAELAYPDAVVHTVQAHGLADGAGVDAARRVLAARTVFAELARIDFESVYCLNYSGISLAASALFDPDIVHGYRLRQGQLVRDLWTRLAFRWIRDRRRAGINLVDFWAAHAPQPAPAEKVNPAASPKGGGVGVALAGRHARRALPPEVLAPVAAALFAGRGGKRLVLLGTRDQAPAAAAVMKRLPPKVVEKTENLTGKTDLRGLAEELSGLDVLLTPDTGAMHLAAHLGTPVYATFLSSAWAHETGPYGAGHMVWQAAAPCAPCLETAPCGCGLRCLDPFSDPAFPRLSAGGAAALPDGLVAYETSFDALGVVNVPVMGEDPLAGPRNDFRAFAVKHLGLDPAGETPVTPETARRLYAEPDWIVGPAEASEQATENTG